MERSVHIAEDIVKGTVTTSRHLHHLRLTLFQTMIETCDGILTFGSALPFQDLVTQIDGISGSMCSTAIDIRTQLQQPNGTNCKGEGQHVFQGCPPRR